MKTAVIQTQFNEIILDYAINNISYISITYIF